MWQKNRQAFSVACRSLFRLNFRFYPAILKIFMTTGINTFDDPKEAESFISQIERDLSKKKVNNAKTNEMDY